MPWMVKKIPVKPTSGNYFWVVQKDYILNTWNDHEPDKLKASQEHKAEVHVTVSSKDIKPGPGGARDMENGTFKEFHVKFDVKTSGTLRIFFFFTESGGSASISSSKGTSEGDAKKMGILKGEYAEMKTEAIRVATTAAAKFKG